MWICLSDAFFSIVDPAKGGNDLLVRARRNGDIERYFPGHKVERTVGRDYLFRASVPRGVVAATIATSVSDIEYPNFKNSVRDDKLHTAYSGFWNIMARVQEVPPYSNVRTRAGKLL